jgi:hypothetical protein
MTANAPTQVGVEPVAQHLARLGVPELLVVIIVLIIAWGIHKTLR